MKKVIFCVLTVIILSVIAGINFSLLKENPFSQSFEFDYPYKVKIDEKKNSYIIDSSRRRILKKDADGKFEFKIDGGLRKDGTIFNANDLAVDDNGNVYVLNLVTDTGGFYTIKEEILKFSPQGKFLNLIYKREYDIERTTLIQRGEITSLVFSDGFLSWFILGNDEISYFQLDLSEYSAMASGGVKERKLYYKDANIMLYSVRALDENRWVFSTKQGEIKIYNFISEKYESGTMVNEDGHLRVRYSLAVSKGDVYFVDIGDMSFYQYVINNETQPQDEPPVPEEKKIFSVSDFEDIEESIFYFVDIIEIDNERISATAIGNIIIKYNLTTDSLIGITDIVEYKDSRILIRAAVFIAALISLFLIFYLAAFLYKHKLKGKIPAMVFKVAGIIVIVVVATALIVTMMISNFSHRYEGFVVEKSSLMVQLISKNLNGDLFENIKSQGDFMGSDYKKIRSDIIEALNYNRDNWNKNFYFAIYRLVDDTLCGFMYLSDEIGPVYPFRGWYEEEGSAPSRALKGEIVHEKDTDEFGTWIYSLGPIRNSKREVVAIIEVGSDLFSFEQENKKLIQSILLDVATMLIIVILCSIEIIYLGQLLTRKKEFELNKNPELVAVLSKVKYKRKQDSSLKIPIFSYSILVRPFNFIYTLAVSMSVAFVPIMMKYLYTDYLSSGAGSLFGLPGDVVIALPISIEMLFFGIALFLGGMLISKVGWKSLQMFGITFAMAGLFLSGYCSDVYLFLISRGVIGFGSGLVLLASRSVINLEKDPIIKSAAYSNFYSGGLAGVTVGAVFGGFFADHIGFSNVFYIAFCVGIIAFVFSLQIFIKNKNIINKVNNSVLKNFDLKIVLKFLFNIKVLSYFLLIIIPTYSAGMFLTYYLPLYAETQGISIADIGRLFMLNGLMIIYLGPVVSILAKKNINNEVAALVIGSIGWALSLIIFAVTGNVAGLVLTLIIMGLTEGFCVVAQNDYFLNLKIVSKLGEDVAVSYFEIAAKAAEIIAPIIFGWVLILGASIGMWAFGMAILVAALIFLIISTIKFRRRS